MYQTARKIGTTTGGAQFPTAVVRQVWLTAFTVPGYDPAQYRMDRCGAWIAWSAYGTTGNHGWEIDHIFPVARGGSDATSNLQALHWRNNRGKSDNYPNWSCALRAS